MKTQLFIEGYEVELNDKVQFLLNKQFEELDNPTVICNDWSKTVSIPFTEANNRLFGYIYKPNRIILADPQNPQLYKYMQMYFDPTKKLDFKLVYNSFVLMEGYAKMNNITRKGNSGTYNITLNGQLGKMFQDMKKITFDNSTSDTTYLINGSDYVDTYINADLIYSSWMSSGQYQSVLKKKTDEHYHLTDIIGFAPNNSFSEGFKYDSFQPEPNASMQFKEVLGDSFTEATGIDADTVIPDGMLPREIGEYRSYLQLPFIYWNKLFQIFQEKAEAITGYTFELDDDWFNQSNPYWFNLVYMLRPFNAKDGTMQENANYYTANPYGSMGWQRDGDINTMTTHRTVNLCTYTNGTNVETVPMIDLSVTFSDGKWFTLDDTNINPIFKIKTKWSIWDGLNGGSSSESHLSMTNALVIIVKAVGENGYEEQVKFFVKHSTCVLVPDSGANIIIFDGSTLAGGTDKFDINADFLVTKAKFGNSVRFRFESYWKNTTKALTSGSKLVNLDPDNGNNPQYTYVTLMNGVHRSFAHFTLNDLWNNDFNLFDEIIKYCKIFRIGISADNFNKKIIFKPITEYFENYTIEDWTNKIDMSKDFTIKPITFENKYVLFNYEDNKTKMGSEYKEKFGVNYGEYRLSTDYNFNTETKKLFNKVQSSITNSDNVLSWENLYTYKKIVYSMPAEIFVYNKDKDRKQVDMFGAYYFHNGLASFSTESSLHLRDVKLSDDTAFQQANNTYCYTQQAANLTEVYTYPKLDIIRGSNICLFNTPSENYTYLSNYSNTNSIYSNFWEPYINERYNIQNKLVTCYITFTPSDYSSFKWNNFVKIDNVICMINKIYDYDITNNESTKVDLVTIQDLSGYTQNNYQYDYIKLSSNELRIPYDYYKQITLTSTKRWEIKSDDWSDNLVATPTSGYAGTTDVLIGSISPVNGGTITFELLDDNDNVIGESKLTVTVGGTGTITVAGDWYTEYPISTVNPIVRRNVTNSVGDWRIIKVSNGGGVSVNYSPAIGVAGSNQITYSVSSSSSPTGVVDFYVGNDAGDITSFRVNFIQAPSSTIYTLNSSGTEYQSTDSVDYHGTSSTRGYKVYSSSAWTVTLPQGVSAYGPTSGSAGTTDVTFNWGSGVLNSTKTITFTNNDGNTCELECTYVSL